MLHWRAGHINFNDEVSAAMRLADGVLLVVDAAEGVMMVTDKVIKQAVAEGLPICLLLSKVWAPPSAAGCCTLVLGTQPVLSWHGEAALLCSRRWTGSRS